MRSLPSVAGWVSPAVLAPVVVYLALFHGAPAAAATGALCFSLVLWPRPDTALLLLLGAVPVAALVDPGGTTLPAMAMAAVALLLFRLVPTARVRIELALVMCLSVAITVSYFLPLSPLQVERPWKAWALVLTGLGLLAATVLAPPEPRRVVRIVAGSGTGVAGYLLVRAEYADHRLTGLGLNPNYVGAVLALSLVAAVGLARLDRSRAWLLPALVCAAALLQTRSRGAFLMAAAGLVCALLAGRPLRHKALITVTALVPALLLPGSLDALEGSLTGSRSATELTANAEVRKRAALLAVRVAFDHPFRGIGYAMFPEYARTSSSLGIYINTHNDYLRLAAESGFVALVLLLALLWLGLARRCTADLAVLQALCLAYAVGLLFANTLTDVLVSAPFWTSLGCLLARSRRDGPAPAAVAEKRPPSPREDSLPPGEDSLPPGKDHLLPVRNAE